ncbi:MAG: helix-turn-helix transcriptional regulator [Hellea sp.]
MPANIHDRIKSRRKALGLSQYLLAKACGVGQSTVANWERGGHIPRQASIHKIAAALETDEIWLLSGERANMRGPLNAYMNRPIRHVAVFDWPQNAAALRAALPRTFIAITADQESIFALALAQDLENFSAGTVLAFTRDYDPAQPGLFLDISEAECGLSDSHSANCDARLIYSFTPH